MTEEESLLAAIHEGVELLPHDLAWPGAFELERSRLSSLFPGVFVAIEHIGSTAIPEMTAKPIIDILGGVDSLDGVDVLSRRLCESGYTTSEEFNASLQDRKWFMRWANGRRTHHLHVVVHDGPVWRDRLAFRDLMRANPQAAAEYESLKARLAIEYRDDREAYTEAKARFVRAALSSPRLTSQMPTS